MEIKKFDDFDEELEARNLISKYLRKVSKFVKEIKTIDPYSFTFSWDGKDYFIGYHFDSICVVFNEGDSLDVDNARELGLYEVEDIFN